MSRNDGTKKGIVLFGGTFNPIHQGHIRLCCSAWKAVHPRLVVLMPTQPFYKELNTEASQRIEMCQRAVESLPFPVAVDGYEIQQGSTCRTYDTLCAMKQKFPDDHLYLLMGSDTFLSFSYWYRWRECGRMAGLLVGMRKSDDREQIEMVKSLVEQDGITVQLLDHQADDISSHDIRQHQEKQREELAPAVYTYIREHHLYENDAER